MIKFYRWLRFDNVFVWNHYELRVVFFSFVLSNYVVLSHEWLGNPQRTWCFWCNCNGNTTLMNDGFLSIEMIIIQTIPSGRKQRLVTARCTKTSVNQQTNQRHYPTQCFVDWSGNHFSNSRDASTRILYVLRANCTPTISVSVYLF